MTGVQTCALPIWRLDNAEDFEHQRECRNKESTAADRVSIAGRAARILLSGDVPEDTLRDSMFPASETPEPVVIQPALELLGAELAEGGIDR